MRICALSQSIAPFLSLRGARHLYRCLSSSPAAAGGGGAVLAELRALSQQLREQLTPCPDVPGTVQTTLIDPQGWRERSAAEVELAFKLSLWMTLQDYGNLGALLVGRPTSFPAGGVPPLAPEGAATAGVLPATSEEVRQVALQAASRLSVLSRDEQLRLRLAAMGSEALQLTRECLDEFLTGYEEGKNQEIRAYLEDRARQEDTLAVRLQRVRDEVASELQGRARGGGSGTTAAAGSAASAGGAPPRAQPLNEAGEAGKR